MTERRGRALAVTAAAVLSVGAVVGIVSTAGLGAVAARLTSVDPTWIGLLAGAEAAAYVGYALAYAALARAAELPGMTVLHSAGIATAGFGAHLPSGGFGLDVRVLRQRGAAPEAARDAALGLGALEYATIAPAVWTSSLLLLNTPHVERSLTLPWLVGVPAGTLGALIGVALRERLPGRLQTLLSPLSLLGRLLRRPKLAAAAYGGMALYWAGEIASLWAAVRIFGAVLSAPVAILVLATGYALTRRTLPLAGAGLTEVLLAFTLMWAGVGLGVAILGVIAYRLFNVWATLPASAAAAAAVDRVPGHL